jgi:hypothetical protein
LGVEGKGVTVMAEVTLITHQRKNDKPQKST